MAARQTPTVGSRHHEPRSRPRRSVRWCSLRLLGGCACLLSALACSRPLASDFEPGTGDGMPEAREGALRGALQRLIEAQHSYHETHGRYADHVWHLRLEEPDGVLLRVLQGDARGYAAIARGGEAECAVYSGAARPPRSYLLRSDVVACGP